MKKVKVIKLLQRIAAVVLTLIFGISYTGTIIALENGDMINSALGTSSFKIKGSADAANQDAEYYKSDFKDLADLIKAGSDMTEEVMEEGAVLFKNDNNSLPLTKDSRKVSVFGVTASDPIYGGTGSGSVDISKAINLYDGFEDAGLELNPVLKEKYLNDWYLAPDPGDFWNGVAAEPYDESIHFRRNSQGWGGSDGIHIGGVPWEMVTTEADDSFASYGDAAIFVLGRVGGEGADLKMTGVVDGYNGDYLHLNQCEMDTLAGLKAMKDQGVFKKIIVIYNGASMVSADFINDVKYGVDAFLWVGTLGQNGASAVGNILTGEVVPSGKLTDTFWVSHEMNPVNVNYGYREYVDSEKYGMDSKEGNMFVPEPTLNAYTVYQEGMYLGYRYTETRYEDAVAGAANVGDYDYSQVVAYPFGYGLSYTTFSYDNYKVKKVDERTYQMSVDVTNIGSEYSGKEVVQFYIAKPYGDYAINNKIQVPSVELVEFGKTGNIAPGDTETVTVTVDEKYFTSFDAYGAGTYVLMPGDYYLIAANNSHQAVNNLLAAKGISSSKMVGTGNADMAVKLHYDLDVQKYLISDTTGNPIVSLFDYGDINRYKGRGDNSVEYYNRSNWEGTVSLDRSNGFVILNATQQIADDILSQCPVEYNRPLPKDSENIAYPIYGKEANLNLVDMQKDSEGNPIDSDDPLWDTFMDQLTWDETAKLVGNGQHITALVESIGKPETNDENGPNGFNQVYNKQKEGLAYRIEAKAGHIDSEGNVTDEGDPNGFLSTTAFPANGLIAATFNRDVAYRVGNIIGNDGIWSGCAGLYGIGANIHRSPYLGRTAEYYSEDGTLTGLIAASECKGIEKKGVHVYDKHAVVNDQETARHGVGVWVTEQAIREIYLRAFELPITIGGAYNTMASFARIGTVAGPADGVLGEDFLRGESGMKGIIVTDMYTDMNGKQDNSPYFELSYGIYTGGSDLPDGTGQEGQFDIYRPNSSGNGDYADMAWAMRQAAKRICYSVANSNAMNGLSTGTEIVHITPWWQRMLIALDIISGILLAVTAFWVVIYHRHSRKMVD
jgi:beta-glucosidase